MDDRRDAEMAVRSYHYDDVVWLVTRRSAILGEMCCCESEGGRDVKVEKSGCLDPLLPGILMSAVVRYNQYFYA